MKNSALSGAMDPDKTAQGLHYLPYFMTKISPKCHLYLNLCLYMYLTDEMEQN